MIRVVKMENISYKKQDHLILDSISFEIYEGEFVSILGPMVAGKTSLVNIILGNINDYDGKLYIYNKNIKKTKPTIHFSLISDELNNFATNKVIDELEFSLRDMKLSSDEVSSRIKAISTSLNIKELLDCIPSTLSCGEKVLVKLASILIKQPKVLIVDGAFETLDGFTKEKVLKLLKKLCKKNKMTVIYVTENSDDTLYSERIFLLSNGKVYLDSKINDAFDDEKIYREARIHFPFMVDLSKKLQYYELVDNIEFNMDKLVNNLWK